VPVSVVIDVVLAFVGLVSGLPARSGARLGGAHRLLFLPFRAFDHWMLLSARITPSMFQGARALRETLLVSTARPTSPLSFFSSRLSPV